MNWTLLLNRIKLVVTNSQPFQTEQKMMLALCSRRTSQGWHVFHRYSLNIWKKIGQSFQPTLCHLLIAAYTNPIHSGIYNSIVDIIPKSNALSNIRWRHISSTAELKENWMAKHRLVSISKQTHGLTLNISCMRDDETIKSVLNLDEIIGLTICTLHNKIHSSDDGLD